MSHLNVTMIFMFDCQVTFYMFTHISEQQSFPFELATPRYQSKGISKSIYPDDQNATFHWVRNWCNNS